MSSEYMEKLYGIYPWPDNPYTSEGRARYEEALKHMENIIQHEWFKKLIESRDHIVILEFCGGCGIGGVALSRVIREKHGLPIDLTIIDLRRNSLETAKKFSREELGFEAKTIVHDVTEKIDLGRKHDVALLWGHSTPHFAPWDYIRLLANIHRSLGDHGIYFYDEGDRIYSVFMRMGYKEVLPEITGEHIVLTFHKDIDPLTGYIYRIAYDLVKNNYIEMKIHMWGLANSMAYTWMFFEDIDFIPLKSRFSGVVIAWRPRSGLNVEKYFEKPRVLTSRGG